MPHISLPETAHQHIKNHLQQGRLAIDATVGNGHDTLFLSQQVGVNGHVYGFDIQPAAIESTHNLLFTQGAADNVSLFLISHADMALCIPPEHWKHIQVIMFNLGYLPGSDKTIITSPNSTLKALNIAVELLAVGGVISILAYPGHPGGAIETAAVEHWFYKLDTKLYRQEIILSQTSKPNAPKLLLLEKRL
jgi:predicted methyltransferase